MYFIFNCRTFLSQNNFSKIYQTLFPFEHHTLFGIEMNYFPTKIIIHIINYVRVSKNIKELFFSSLVVGNGITIKDRINQKNEYFDLPLPSSGTVISSHSV